MKSLHEEKIVTVNLKLDSEELILIKGKFLSHDEIYVEIYHIHSKLSHISSVIVISLPAIVWLNCIFLAGRVKITTI